MGIDNNNVMDSNIYETQQNLSEINNSFNFQFNNTCTIYTPQKTQLLNYQSGKGLEITGSFGKRSGILFLDLTLKNLSLVAMSDFSIALNKNTFGVGVSPGGVFPQILLPQQSIDVTIPLNYQGIIQAMVPINLLQTGIKNNIDVFYFNCYIPLHFCLIPNPVVNMGIYI